MTKRSLYVERSWRCCAIGCSDYLTMRREDLSESPDPENRAMYLEFDWGRDYRSLWERLKAAWRIVRHAGPDWQVYSVEEPHTAREMAEWLLLGAQALEREQNTYT